MNRDILYGIKSKEETIPTSKYLEDSITEVICNLHTIMKLCGNEEVAKLIDHYRMDLVAIRHAVSNILKENK